MLPSAQNSRHELGHLAAVHLSLGDYVLTGAGYLQALPMRLWGTANQCQSAYCNAALARKKFGGFWSLEMLNGQAPLSLPGYVIKPKRS